MYIFSIDGHHISMSHERPCFICFVVWPTASFKLYIVFWDGSEKRVSIVCHLKMNTDLTSNLPVKKNSYIGSDLTELWPWVCGPLFGPPCIQLYIGAVVARVNESALARHPILSVVDYCIEALNSLPASMWVNKHKRQQALRFVTLYILTRSKAWKIPAFKIKY